MKPCAYAATAFITLSACGGGGGLPVEPFPLEPLEPFELPSGPSEYVALTKETVAIYDRLPPLVVTDLPDSGTASYDGTALAIKPSVSGGYLGDFNASVDFGRQEFTGTADRFYYDANEDISVAGSGTLVEGSLDFTEIAAFPDSYAVSVNGTLHGDTINAEGLVFFLGRSAEGLLGAFATEDDTFVTVIAEDR